MQKFEQPLWPFSLALYQTPAMESLCIELQDRHGVNVDLLLWALWLDQSGIAFTEQFYSEATASIRQWHAWVVLPLRWLRRNLPKRGRLGYWRERVKTRELQAEIEELARLQRQTECLLRQTASGPSRASRTGSESYVRRLLGQHYAAYEPRLLAVLSAAGHRGSVPTPGHPARA